MKVLAIIPARKGSKRLKNKNILYLGKKPLVQITIEFAKKLNKIHDIIVSTDDTKVMQICKKLNVKAPFLRPANLSGDKSSSASVCAHAIDFYEKKYCKIDAILLLQPTSPFRSIRAINSSIEFLKKLKTKSIVSVNSIKLNSLSIIKKKKIYNSYLFKNTNNIFKINGNFYLIDKKLFLSKKKFFFPKTFLYKTKDFKQTIDIDDINDFKIAQLFLKTSTN